MIRDGSEQEIPAAKLVVGDLVCLQAGAMVPADLRLVEAENLQLQEAALTGKIFRCKNRRRDFPENRAAGSRWGTGTI